MGFKCFSFPHYQFQCKEKNYAQFFNNNNNNNNNNKKFQSIAKQLEEIFDSNKVNKVNMRQETIREI